MIAQPLYADEVDIDGLSSLSLEELLNVQTTRATLTETSLDVAPATITHISKTDIARSSARDLDELLRIYVPAFQTMRKANGDSIGIRGVISDRNDKFLILVNGKVMNERTVLGGISERFISLLGDIEYINVIRGPGSVISGPGAIAGTIEIVTKSAQSAEGTNLRVRGGAIDQFASAEISSGNKLTENASIYTYFGLDSYEGASVKNAPFYFSKSFTSSKGEVVSGEPVTYDMPNESRAYRDRLRFKAHAQYNYKDFELWARYVNGGQMMHASEGGWREDRSPDDIEKRDLGYQHFTIMGSYNHIFTETFSINTDLSFDMMDLERENGRHSPDFRSYREDEYFARVMAQWTPLENHSIAFGTEYRHEIFGKDSPGYPNVPNFITPQIGEGALSWKTDTLSVLGEYKLDFSSNLTLYAGLRYDDNQDLKSNLSSRVALVTSIDDNNIVKLTFNNSVRNPVESAKKEAQLKEVAKGEPETIKFFEARWERKFSDAINFAVGGYYADHNISAHNTREGTTEVLGAADYYGLEFEFSYTTDNIRITLAHNLTDLMKFDLTDPSLDRQHITAAPYGYGSNFANWSNHQTTANFVYNVSDKLETNASATILWGYPGAKDYVRYNNDVLGGSSGVPNSTGNLRAFEESIFLNMGMRYQLKENLIVNLNAHNILGWADKRLNKNNVFLRSGLYQSEAASISASIDLSF